jgi:hypothetical protein
MMKTPYEPGMKVSYDAVSHKVTVAFRGRVTILPGQFETQDQADWAGENYCRHHGWHPATPKVSADRFSYRRA